MIRAILTRNDVLSLLAIGAFGLFAGAVITLWLSGAP